MKTKTFYTVSVALLLLALMWIPYAEDNEFMGVWIWEMLFVYDEYWLDYAQYLLQIILALVIIITMKLLFVKDK